MKTVSLRSFRVSVPTEAVTVVVRRDGELITLGTWTPYRTPDSAKVIPEHVVEEMAHVATAPTPFRSRAFTPVPKVQPKRHG